MKKLLAGLFILSFLFTALPTFQVQAEDIAMTAENNYQQVAKDSWWQRFTDWLATVGKSDSEKARIIAERRSERNANKITG